MVIDTTLLKFILTLEYERRKVVLALESMDHWDEVLHSFIYEWPKGGSTFDFVDRTKSYGMTFQLKATKQKHFRNISMHQNIFKCKCPVFRCSTSVEVFKC